MPEELQNLLERIQEDGVEKAEARAKEIISAAQDKAARIMKDAVQKAEDMVQKAESDAEAFSERAKQSLTQAARDVILSVGQALDRILSELTANTVTSAISDDTLRQMIVKAMETYCQQSRKTPQLDFILNEEDAKTVTTFLMDKYREKLNHGIEVRSENDILGGFKLTVDNNKVQHDFTSESIAEAMSQLVRPQLAEIVRNAARQDPS